VEERGVRGCRVGCSAGSVLGQDLLCTVAMLKVQDGLKTRSASEAGGKDRDEIVFILRE